MSNLPPLLVAVPILAAVLALLVGYWVERAGWVIVTLAALVQTAVAGRLALTVFADGRVVSELGGFVPPYGITLVVDELSAFVALLIPVVSVAVLAYARRAGPHGSAFYTELSLLMAGLTGVAITGDVFNMYVFLEITGLAAYAVVASSDDGLAAVAGLKYLIIGTVGASLFLAGVAYAFIVTGTLNMVDLSARLAEVGYTHTAVQTAFVLIVVGLGVKSALYPLHTWQPDAYAAAPDSVSGYISALVSTVSAYALARVVYSVFTVDFFVANPLARDLLVYAASLSVIAGSVLAVMQSDVKRMLAYSSVSQFGLIVAAFGIANETAFVGGTIHLVGHAIMKGALFLGAGVIATVAGARTVREYSGLAGRAPVTSGAFAVLALGMVGIPPAVGFVGKWYIALGAVEAEAWVVAAVILASTVLTLAYFLRLIEAMYFRPAAESAAASADRRAAADGGRAAGDGTELDDRSVSFGMVAVVVVAAVAAVALGFVASGFEPLLEPTLSDFFQP